MAQQDPLNLTTDKSIPTKYCKLWEKNLVLFVSMMKYLKQAIFIKKRLL